jgi:hypothetical protein
MPRSRWDNLVAEICILGAEQNTMLKARRSSPDGAAGQSKTLTTEH